MAASPKPEKSEPGMTVIRTVEPSGTPFALRSPIGQILTRPDAAGMLSKLLPRGATLERFIFEVYHAVVQNPEILECTEQSILLAVGRAIESDLVIGKTVHLVPVNTKVSKRGEPERYEKRLQTWMDYKGEIELVMRAGVARFVDAHAVYEHETFRVEQGTRPSIQHVPIMDEAKRGRMIGGYAYAVLPGYLLKIVTMTLKEVNEIRKNSKQWKHLPECPAWYVEKTCFHRVTKALPKNAKLAKVLALFEAEDREDQEETDAIGSVDPGTGEFVPAASEGIAATTATPNDDDDSLGLPFDNEGAAAREPLPCESYAIPDGLGPRSGQTLGTLSTVDLGQLYRWASKERALVKYPDLAHHCADLLEARRLGDAKEPTA